MEPQERQPRWLIAAGAAGFLLYLALPLLRGLVYTEDDLGAFHLPLRDFYQQCLNNGESFIWTPYLFNGFYLLGEGQIGMLHPVQALLYRLLPLASAFTLELWLSYPFALLGMYMFLRRWDLSVAASIFGGFCFALLGFNLNHYIHLHFVATLAHLPWSLYAIDVLVRRADTTRVSVGALFLLFVLSASQLLKAMPQAIIFSWLAEAGYAAVLLGNAALRTSAWGVVVRSGALMLIVKLLAIGVAGAQLLPLWEGLQASYRANPGEDFRQSISLHPWNLMQFFNPYLFQRRVYAPFSGDEPWDAIYFGAAAPALLVLVVARWRILGPGRLLAGFGLGLAAFGLLAALGHYGFLYTLLDGLPVLNQLRAPARYVALFHAGLAIALPLGLMMLWERGGGASCPPLKGVPEGRGMLGVGDDVTSQPVRESTSPLISLRRRMMPNDALGLSVGVTDAQLPGRCVWCLLLPTLFALISLLLPLLLAAHLMMPLRSALLGAGFVCVGSVLVWACARGIRFAPVLLIMFVLTDAGVYGLRHKPTQTINAYLAEIPHPPGKPGARIDTDIHPTYMNRYGMLGYRVPFGYTALMPARALDYTQENALRVAGVQWREARHSASPELAEAFERGETWVRLPNAVPRMRAVTAPDTLSPVEARLEIEKDSPGRLRVDLSTESAAWLFIAESWHPGWRAAVDGEPVDLVRARFDFMAVPVESGNHQVAFVFDPASYRNGKRITLTSLGVSGVFFASLLYRGRRD